MENRIKEIVVDSRDRTVGSTSSSDFTVTLQKRLDLASIGVKSANIFYTWYNINSTNNNIDFSEGAGELTATVTPGCYTSTTLKSALETALNAAGALTYTVTFNTTTLKTTIAATGVFSLLFATGTHISTDMAEVLGYTATDKTAAATYTSTNVFNLNTVNYLLIKLTVTAGTYNSVTSTNTSDNTIGNIAVIPVQTNPGYLVTYYDETPPMTNLYGAGITSLSIKLTTYNNTAVDLNGCEWSMILRTYTLIGGN